MFGLGLLFVTVTSLEILVFMQVGNIVGPYAVIAMIFLTGFLGAYLVRMQGLMTMRKISEQLQQGQMPAKEILSGVVLLIVGALLVTPGLITDVTGFLLLIPPIRMQVVGLIQARMERWVMKNAVQVDIHSHGPMDPHGHTQRPHIIDIEP